MSTIPITSQFNIGGTWSQLALNNLPPSVNQINIGCYVYDEDSGTVYYRTIFNEIVVVPFGGSGAIATPITVGTVYGLVDSGTTGNTGLGYNTLEKITGSQNTAVGAQNFPSRTVNNTTTIGYGNTTTASSITGAITVGSNNSVNNSGIIVGNNNTITAGAPGVIIIGSGITTGSTPYTLYIDPTITGIAASGLSTTGVPTYGIVSSGGILSLGPLPVTPPKAFALYDYHSNSVAISSSPTTLTYPTVITNTLSGYQAGILTASTTGTYQYYYHLTLSATITASTVVTWNVMNDSNIINSGISHLSVIISGIPAVSTVVLVGTVTLSSNGTLFVTVSSSDSLTANLANSYLRIKET